MSRRLPGWMPGGASKTRSERRSRDLHRAAGLRGEAALFANDSIYLMSGDHLVEEMGNQPYESEDLLQELLAKNPDLLAGGQMNADVPRRWLLVRRELGVPSGEGETSRLSLDHLFIDQDGIPTLVEVKRSTDTRLRREVVGQMLDYAANGSKYWPPESLEAEFAAGCSADDVDAGSLLAKHLAGDDADAFWPPSERTSGRAGCAWFSWPTSFRRSYSGSSSF